jgi:hypothetical protein
MWRTVALAEIRHSEAPGAIANALLQVCLLVIPCWRHPFTQVAAMRR